MTDPRTNPDAYPVIATVDAVVNHEVETFAFRMVNPSEGATAEKAALESILWTLTASTMPAESRRNPVAIREAAGSRPHRRIHITATARASGMATAQLVGIGGGDDDVNKGEGMELDKRVMRLLAARVLEELATR